jgi:hypothetical protein
MIGSVTQYQDAILSAEKGRRRREQAERERHDLAATEAPDTEAVGQGHLDAMGAEEASKFAAEAQPGPDRSMQPRPVQPGMFDRPYIDDGHAAESPQAEAPRENPMPQVPPGIVTPITLRAAPAAFAVPHHVASAFTGGSPSER